MGQTLEKSELGPKIRAWQKCPSWLNITQRLGVDSAVMVDLLLGQHTIIWTVFKPLYSFHDSGEQDSQFMDGDIPWSSPIHPATI